MLLGNITMEHPKNVIAMIRMHRCEATLAAQTTAEYLLITKDFNVPEALYCPDPHSHVNRKDGRANENLCSVSER